MSLTIKQNRPFVASSVLVGVLALTGCSSSTPDAAGEEPTASAPAAPSAGSDDPVEPAETPADDAGTAGAIGCEELDALAVAITTGLQFSEPDSSEHPTSTACVWVTPEVESASLDLAAYGALGITVDGTGWTTDEMDTLSSMMGTVVDDPRAADVDGRILLGSHGEMLADVGTLQLLFPEGTVTILASGVMLDSAAGGIEISVDDAIGVAAEIAALRR